jgi:hypothetical protein
MEQAGRSTIKPAEGATERITMNRVGSMSKNGGKAAENLGNECRKLEIHSDHSQKFHLQGSSRKVCRRRWLIQRNAIAGEKNMQLERGKLLGKGTMRCKD